MESANVLEYTTTRGAEENQQPPASVKTAGETNSYVASQRSFVQPLIVDETKQYLDGIVPDQEEEDNESYDGDNNKTDTKSKGKKTRGRVKIKMEFIQNKLRRYTTFSKRKTGIMKKVCSYSNNYICIMY